MPDEQASSTLSPVAFVSSFTREFGDLEEDGSARKDGLRFKAWAIGEEMGRPVWVAECSRPDLKGKEPLEIVDCLLANVRRSDVFICLLGGKRRGQDEHGTLVQIGEKVSAVSYFETEVFMAALLGKPIEVFVAEDFDPGPRLASLLEMLRFALPPENWRTKQSERDILQGIRAVLLKRRRVTSTLLPIVPSAFRRIAGNLLARAYDLRAVRGGRTAGFREVLFLDGFHEPRGVTPDKELVTHLLECERTAAHTEAKLARLWVVLRELMAKPPSQDGAADFLPLWNEALGRWASNSAWYGLHGHIYLGQAAALFSVAQIREMMRAAGATRHPPEVIEHPGGLSSALYSIAKLMPTRGKRRQVLEDGMVHLTRTINERGQLTANLAHMRGSYQLQMGDTANAVADFEEALRLTRKEKGDEGVSLSELGFAYLHQMRLFKGRENLKAGAESLAQQKEAKPGFYVRAMRKLAFGYFVTGRWDLAFKARAEAREFAAQRGLFDQIR